MKIETANTTNATLEALRPEQPIDWQLVASGFWFEGMYHSGHIAYFIASLGHGEWLMEGLERNAELDGITEEDVEEGRLNDDQSQAMSDTTFEEAQDSEHRQIVAACSGAGPNVGAREIAAVLYRAVCKSGGKTITEPDDAEGLLDL